MLSDDFVEEKIAISIANRTAVLEQMLSLSVFIKKASEILSCTLLNDSKIIVLGTGISSALAQIFCANLMHKFEIERPSLPAIAISADSIVTNAFDDESQSCQYAKQLRSLAKNGDSCVILSPNRRSNPKLVQSILAAHEKELPIIALTGFDGGEIATLLNDQDVELRIASEHVITVREQHLMLLHCLNELIDNQIFG